MASQIQGLVDEPCLLLALTNFSEGQHMPDQSITCPHCGKRIPLSEAITHDIADKLKKEFEADSKRKEKEFEKAFETQQNAYDEKLNKERAKLERAARKEAEESVSTELADLKTELERKSKQVKDAEKKELDFLKRQRDLDDKERTLKLETERTLAKERKKIWDEASSKSLEEHQLKDREKDNQLSEMRKQIEELKRKAELGSQQAQGEALELELEELLRSTFRQDDVDAVSKGVKGGDVIQKVNSSSGSNCGSILWEAKRTKAWSDSWLDKLKDDQRQAKSDLAVIVSSVLPKGINRFGNLDGIWVTDFLSVVGLATALRTNLIQVYQARNALVGKNEKMELIYKYLSGPEFRQRVEVIVESFVSMNEDLNSEKRAMEKTWAKREKQIQRVIHSTAGMYGDLQAMIGASLPEIKILQLPSGKDSD
ncbi:MAG: DUF2130 domain-containing protein [Bacteroidota bacterium]